MIDKTRKWGDKPLTWARMASAIQKGLPGLPDSKAIALTRAFKAKTGLSKEDVSEISARFTDDGLIEIAYVTNGKKKKIKL